MSPKINLTQLLEFLRCFPSVIFGNVDFNYSEFAFATSELSLPYGLHAIDLSAEPNITNIIIKQQIRTLILGQAEMAVFAHLELPWNTPV
jgi:hypothetical protein